jgi:hypothetical protein
MRLDVVTLGGICIEDISEGFNYVSIDTVLNITAKGKTAGNRLQ